MDTCPSCGWKPKRRLTATPAGVTVWVTETEGDGELLLRPYATVVNRDAANEEGWARLSRASWEQLRDVVDRYFEAINEPAPANQEGRR